MVPQTFINMVMDEVTAAGMSVEITKGRWVACGTACAGYFCEKDKILKVAGGAKGWFGVFVHEYGHFTQWRDNCKPWRDLKDSCERFDEWMNDGKDFQEKSIDRYFKGVRNMELDCERRAVKIIKKFDLPIDLNHYIRSANAYIYFHAYMRKYRTWYKGVSPHSSKRIIKTMPAVFLGRDKYNVMPEKYERLVNEICFKGKPNESYHKRVA